DVGPALVTLPNRRCSPGWTTRAIMSIEPPAANGTTIRIGADGHGVGAAGSSVPEICPAATLAVNGATKPPSKTERRVGMIAPPRHLLKPADCRAYASASPRPC